MTLEEVFAKDCRSAGYFSPSGAGWIIWRVGDDFVARAWRKENGERVERHFPPTTEGRNEAEAWCREANDYEVKAGWNSQFAGPPQVIPEEP